MFPQLLLIFTFCIINTIERDSMINLNEDDKLICYSCKGNNCEKLPNNAENKIICNKKTQLCWAGFIDQQPYRTCASRYCTPRDISLDSDIHIETCCRTNLCNSVSLSSSTKNKSYKQILLSHRPKTFATTTQIVTEVSVDNGIKWDRLSYDKDFSNRVASISSVLLFLMPLLLVLLF